MSESLPPPDLDAEGQQATYCCYVGVHTMDEQSNRSAPQHVLEALAASVRDIAAGRVFDARAVQDEARRMLDEHTVAPESRELPPRRTTLLSRSQPTD